MRQMGLVLMAGVALGAAAAFLLVAHDRSQRAVEALGKAYEASVPKEEMPVVQALPLENPPQVSAGSPGIPAAQQEAANPVQDETASNASLWVSEDTPPVSASAPEGTSRAASRAASGEGTSRAVPFLGVRCENGYITAFWPGGPFYHTWRNWSGGTPPGKPHTIPPGNPPTDLLPARILLDCEDEFANLTQHHPGEKYVVYIYPPDSAVYLALEVTLMERPKTAGRDWY